MAARFDYWHGWGIARKDPGGSYTLKIHFPSSPLPKVDKARLIEDDGYFLDLIRQSPYYLENEVVRRIMTPRLAQWAAQSQRGDTTARGKLKDVFKALSGDLRGRVDPQLKETIARDMKDFARIHDRRGKTVDAAIDEIAGKDKGRKYNLKLVYKRYRKVFGLLLGAGLDREAAAKFLLTCRDNVHRTNRIKEYHDYLFIKGTPNPSHSLFCDLS